jgi:hypothetical protein
MFSGWVLLIVTITSRLLQPVSTAYNPGILFRTGFLPQLHHPVTVTDYLP